MSGWHIDERVAAAYAARMLGTVERASVEAHAVRCDGCRSRIGGLSVRPDGALDPERLWARIETRVVEPPIGRLTSWLLRLGLGEPDAAVLRMIGAQSRQWTIASTLVLALSALAAALGPVSTAPAAFLVLAPLLPPLGVAATYRAMPHGMSLLETTSPYQPARMLLWRTSYVVATAVPPAVALGAVVLARPWASVGWLLPSAACTLLVIAATTWTDPMRPAVFVSLGWAAVVGCWQLRETPWAINAPTTQLTALAVGCAAAVLLQRRLHSPADVSSIHRS
ncbi:MAG: hypothetical protein IT196_25070 [Acidimicrobiales bacterium]|nr:hypothetical protein [Acidimicrobiales bacterium]